MKEKINIAEILKDKPQGTKLYVLLYNIDVELDTIVTTGTKTIVWCTDKIDNNEVCHRFYSEFGTIEGYPDGLQILLPSKEMRDWSKFAWKKGDVLVNKDGNVHIIFEKFEDDSYKNFHGQYYLWEEGGSIVNFEEDENYMQTSDFNKANKEDAQEYIHKIEKILGGKLNLETLEIEKSEFKDGDIVVTDAVPSLCYSKCILILKGDLNTNENSANSYVFYNINNNHISFDVLDTTIRDRNIHLATDSEKQQLFDDLAKKGKTWDAVKKMIVNLKPKVELRPFDKVLCRNSKDDTWEADFFARLTRKEIDYTQSGKYLCVGDLWMYCIPYNEETAHLLGTTEDWEGGEQ